MRNGTSRMGTERRAGKRDGQGGGRNGGTNGEGRTHVEKEESGTERGR